MSFCLIHNAPMHLKWRSWRFSRKQHQAASASVFVWVPVTVGEVRVVQKAATEMSAIAAAHELLRPRHPRDGALRVGGKGWRALRRRLHALQTRRLRSGEKQAAGAPIKYGRYFRAVANPRSNRLGRSGVGLACRTWPRIRRRSQTAPECSRGFRSR